MSDPLQPPADDPTRPRDPTGLFFGALFIALGALWMLLCGACTLFFVSGSLPLVDGGRRAMAAGDVLMVLVISFVLGLPGLGFIFFGRYMRRRAR